MIKKVKMKRHESFSIREGWLTKGIKAVKQNSKVFSSADATDVLGIGTNMVKSLKYWMLATGLVKDSNREIVLSDLGVLIEKYDPYLEDIFSWWIIHITLTINLEDAYVYNLFFNKCLMKNFSKLDIYEKISSLLIENKIEYNENTLHDEINMIIKTYSLDEKIDNPENNFICPLSELGLLKKVDVNLYERTKPEQRKLNFLVMYYLTLILAEEKDYLNIDDLIKLDNSPSKLLNLDKNLINEYLDEMRKNNLIIINRTAGLNMIYFNKKLTLEDIMKEYFE